MYKADDEEDMPNGKGKPSLLVAIGMKPKKKDAGEEEDSDKDESKDAMSDLIDAIHDKDVDLALAAFEHLCELHKDAYEEEESE